MTSTARQRASPAPQSKWERPVQDGSSILDTPGTHDLFCACIPPVPSGTGREAAPGRPLLLHWYPPTDGEGRGGNEGHCLFGSFLASPVWMPRWPLTNPPQKVQVLKTEEKVSDVNIATQLLCDGFDGRFDCAVLISNDADLTMPISFVRDKLRRQVAIVNPSRRLSNALGRNAVLTGNLRGL